MWKKYFERFWNYGSVDEEGEEALSQWRVPALKEEKVEAAQCRKGNGISDGSRKEH